MQTQRTALFVPVGANVMLRRVRIKGYKSLRDVEVRFDKSLSVIIGANAAGKSNLFDALALLSRMVTKRTLGEAFEAHRGSPLEAFSFDGGGRTRKQKKETAEFLLVVDFDFSPSTVDLLRNGTFRYVEDSTNDTASKGDESATRTEQIFRYQLAVSFAPERGVLAISNEKLLELPPNAPPTAEGRTLAERRQNSIIVHGNTDSIYVGRYENAAPDSTLFTQIHFAPESAAILGANVELMGWRFYTLEPEEMRKPVTLHAVPSLASNGADLAAYFRFMKVERPKQFESAVRALRMFIPHLEDFDIKSDFNSDLYPTVRENGITYSSRLISDGTLRILGLLAATHPLEPVSLIGIEEPENGVHPRRLELVASVLASAVEDTGRQILINTHSALLPGYLPDAQVITCRRDDSGTVFETLPDSVRRLGEAEDEVGPNGNEEWLPPTSLFERILRGDYGG